MFRKINYFIDNIEFEKQDVFVNYGRKIGNTFFGIQYSNILTKQAEKFYNIIPQKYRDDFVLSIMEINCDIRAHTDSGVKCVINYYISADNCKTIFYSLKDQFCTGDKIENQTNGSVFKIDDLDYYGDFVAKDGEIWILDVTKPHAIYSIDGKKQISRKAITLQTNKMTYEEVLSIIGD